MRATYPDKPRGYGREQRAWSSNTQRATRVEGAGGSDGATGSRRIKVAHNFPRSVFKCRSKRCNSNDANSRFEAAAGELRATLPRNHACDRPRGPDLSSSVHVKDRVSACVTVTDDEPRSRCTASKNTGDTANRNTSGAAARTPGAQPTEHRRRSSNAGIREARRRVAASGPLRKDHLSLMRSSQVRRSPTRMPKSRFWSAIAASVAGFLMRAASTSGAAVMAPTP